ncbi:hypothetical protein [Persicitalea sp.]|uniref:hypothetical protein n=1 Tax=Persicitalea sp. TaxID=3100273 RepID=UPI0035940851
MKIKNENECLLTVDYIIQTYGEDALEPCCIVTDDEDEETILIPKMREAMSADMWYELPQGFRLFVLQAFYENL